MDPAEAAGSGIRLAQGPGRADAAIGVGGSSVDDSEPGPAFVADDHLVAVVEPVDLAIGPAARAAPDGQEPVAPGIEADDPAGGGAAVELLLAAHHHRHVEPASRLRK